MDVGWFFGACLVLGCWYVIYEKWFVNSVFGFYDRVMLLYFPSVLLS